jgi:hypothetical protein
MAEAVMNDAGALPSYMLDVRELTAEAIAPYGQIIMALRTGGRVPRLLTILKPPAAKRSWR